jgi:hypothetical protein
VEELQLVWVCTTQNRIQGQAAVWTN